MKLVDAVWEKRNLGVDTVEITLAAEDSLEEIRSVLQRQTAGYQVVKCTPEAMEQRCLLTQLGFVPAECILNAVHNLKNTALTGVKKRLADSVAYAPMDDADYARLCKEIEGGLFHSDRIYLDPQFTPAQAARRYIGWLGDERARGTDFYKLLYKDDAVGFFVMKETEPGVFYPFLAGMYPAWQNTGLGFVYNYKPIEEAVRRGGKRISTFVSVNNPNALRMHVEMGFNFSGAQYVFVRHLHS